MKTLLNKVKKIKIKNKLCSDLVWRMYFSQALLMV